MRVLLQDNTHSSNDPGWWECGSNSTTIHTQVWSWVVGMREQLQDIAHLSNKPEQIPHTYMYVPLSPCSIIRYWPNSYRQITTPATHHSVFYRLDTLPDIINSVKALKATTYHTLILNNTTFHCIMSQITWNASFEKEEWQFVTSLWRVHESRKVWKCRDSALLFT